MSLDTYRFEYVYLATTAALRREVAAFWLQQGAIADPSEAERRSHEVVVLVHNRAGELAGLSTVGLRHLPRLGGWHYVYRMFIRPADRVPYLMKEITNRSRDHLRDFAHPDQRVRGLLIVTENRKLMRPGLRRLLKRHGYRPLGRNARGLDVWRVDFQT